jgi:transposase-like protein
MDGYSVVGHRAGAYAEGARDGAPDAIQVADRWHLRHNLAEAAEKTVTRHRGCLKDQPAGDDAAGPDAPGIASLPQPQTPGQAEAAQVALDGSLDACGRERRPVTRTRERHAAIRERLDAGQSLAAICRALNLDRKTVQRFARAASVDELLAGAMNRESKLDPFKQYICQRWNEGITDAAALHAELRLGRQREDRPALRGSVPAASRCARSRAGRAENPPDHPLAADPPRPPAPRRAGTAQPDQGTLPAHPGTGRACQQLRRDDDRADRQPGPGALAHCGRSR